MDTITLRELLGQDEQRLRDALRANNEHDKSREAVVRTLEDELTALLMRYNAACAGERGRQAAADALTASAKDMLALLRASTVEKTETARRLTLRAVVLLFAALGLCAGAVFFASVKPVGGYACALAAAVCAFLSGRFWFSECTTTVRAGVDADAVWETLRRAVETMDRKLGELSAREKAALAEQAGQAARNEPLSEAELRLYGDLLEALYVHNGDFALRQLERLPDFLESRGVELVSCRDDNAEFFVRYPSRRDSATQRPALLREGRLLQMGKATEHVE